MRKDDLVGLVTHYGNDLPLLLGKITEEINAANIASDKDLVKSLTKLHADITDLAIQYARDAIVKINDSPTIDDAITKLRDLKKTIDDIIAGNKKAVEVLGVFSAALPLLKTVAGQLKA
jgi:hypothetical protein